MYCVFILLLIAFPFDIVTCEKVKYKGVTMLEDNDQEDKRPTLASRPTVVIPDPGPGRSPTLASRPTVVIPDPVWSRKMQTSGGWRQVFEEGDNIVEFRFGRNHIREARVQRGLSQRELARRCEMCNSNLSELENGKRKPWAKAVRKISEALGFSPESLFPYERVENAERS
jgi:DNA-binding XRE family transcriptional regulator